MSLSSGKAQSNSSSAVPSAALTASGISSSRSSTFSSGPSSWPEAMGIQQNYLYRVLPSLQKDGLVRKAGRGWHPREAA